MKRISKTTIEHAIYKLHKGIDYTDKDFEQDLWVQLFPFRIKEEKLNQLAKAAGYDKCVRCNKIHSVNDTCVNVVFERRIE
jgi:hypothetical protein